MVKVDEEKQLETHKIMEITADGRIFMRMKKSIMG